MLMASMLAGMPTEKMCFIPAICGFKIRRGARGRTFRCPHEIGVFLGYPLEDVLGFIENGGRNCLSCGCWKVYSNECAALEAFARFEKCKAVYQRLFASGCPLTRLTVAAKTA